MGFVDPYFDESIGELRNLLGATSSEEFRELEPQIVFANELEWSNPTLAKEYANKQKQTDWYENEVNMPSLLSLIPEGTKSVLDFGSGPGQFTAKLAEFYMVEGADVSLPLIEVASQAYPHVSFRQWDGQSPYFEGKKFDVIFSKLTVHFVKDLHKFAHFCRQALSDKGSLVLSVRHPLCTMHDVDGDYFPTAAYIGGSSKYGLQVTMIHRSFQEYVQSFVENGFILTALIEPEISKKQAEEYNVLEKKLHTPKRLSLRFKRR